MHKDVPFSFPRQEFLARMHVHPMYRQGCRYCSLASAYNTSYCSAELQRSRPRQRLHSTTSLNRILAVRYNTTQHNVPRKHVPQDGRRVRSIPSSTSPVHLTNELSSGILFCVGGPALMY
jgi:hypothetical protein